MQSDHSSGTAVSGMGKLNALALKAKRKKEQAVQWFVQPAPGPQSEPFALSDMQQAYWIGRDKDIGGGGIAMQSYVEIDCPALDVGRLEQALNVLVERHPMLRAVVLENGQQRILQTPPPFPVREEDLSHLDASAQERRLQDIAEEMIATVSDLSRWPQSEVRFSRMGASGVGRLHFRLDQWAIDGRSFQIIFEELGALYASPQADLPALRMTFRDYMAALERSQQGAEYIKSDNYWKARLHEMASAPSLPKRSPLIPTDKDTAVTRRESVLSVDDTSSLNRRCAAQGVSYASALGAAYGEVLALWSGTSRFTLNAPRFNRDLSWHPDINNIIGEFASFTLLEVNDSGASFQDKARKFQEETWTSLRHGRVSGMSLLRELARIKGDAEAAAMPVVFTAMPDDSSGGDGLDERIRPIGTLRRLYGSTPQVHLDCVFSIFSGRLHIYWDSRDDEFPDGLVDAMFQEFTRVVRQLATNKEAWECERLAKLPAAQYEARQAAAAPPEALPNTDLVALFDQQAKARPDRIAVLCGDDAVSYRTLREEVGRVAQQVKRLVRNCDGASEALPPHGGCVAILMRRGWHALAAALAVMAAGRPFMPLDVSCPDGRLQTLVNIGGAIALVADDAHSATAQKLSLPMYVFGSQATSAAVGGGGTEQSEQLCAPHTAAYVMSTSGTTGKPKAVTIGQQGLLNAICHSNRRFDVTAADTFLAVTAMHHDMAMYDVFGALTAGASIVTLDPERAYEPKHWVECIVRHGVTIWNSVPGFHTALMKHCMAQGVQLPLRLHILGGDWIPPDTPANVETVCPGAQLYSCGGPTETTLWNILYPVQGEHPEWASIPYGMPIANNSYYVMDAALNELPDWVPGDLYCSGVGVCMHTTSPDERAFATHPRTGERLYRTGDMGRYRPGGIVEILGRSDFQVNIGGYRFNPAEVESALAACPGVTRAVLMPVCINTQSSGDEKRESLGVWVETDGVQLVPEELSHRLQKTLPLTMIPRLWAMGDETPVTANGKVDRKTIEHILADKAKQQCAASGSSLRFAETPLEKLVAHHWGDVLGMQDPHLDANFFQSGGDSLRAMQIIGRIREVIPVPLPLSVFFTTPTVEGVVNAILERLVGNSPSPHAAQDA